MFLLLQKDYSKPNKVIFFSPCGISQSLRDLLSNPPKLKNELKDKWNTNCRDKITKKNSIELKDELLLFIDDFDFNIFEYISPEEFLQQFKTSSRYFSWFGEIQGDRDNKVEVPKDIQDYEFKYVDKLFDTYKEHLEIQNITKKDIDSYPNINSHFNRQRCNFFSADALKSFSRDRMDPEEIYFYELTEEAYSSLIEELEKNKPEKGLDRLTNCLERVEKITFQRANPLSNFVKISDKHGICHYLANEKEEIKWTQ